MTKKESRKNAFNSLLTSIIELLRNKNSGQRPLLGIFFAFFLDTGNNNYKGNYNRNKLKKR